jgi:hypothetical protein
LEILDFEWDSLGTACRERLSELADYRKIHGTAMFLNATAKTSSCKWVSNQRRQLQAAPRRKKIAYDTSRIQALKTLGFE